MSNFTDFVGLLDEYAKKNVVPFCQFTSNLHDTPECTEQTIDKATGEKINKIIHLYALNCNRNVISLDTYAHKVYSKTRYTGNTPIADKDSPASADTFLIDSKDRWFFIEFKNQKIGDTNDSVTKKAYQNYHWLLDIMYEMRSSPIYGGKSRIYNNPVDFAKQYVDYILVVSEDKNIEIYKDVVRLHRAKEKYRKPFIRKLKDYLFHDAYIYTGETFRDYFVRGFRF